MRKHFLFGPSEDLKLGIFVTKLAGLWIRIHFLRIRIRIQSLTLEANTEPDPNPDPDPDPNPIRIQGLNDQKLKKNYN